jgi:hypothetical protein
MELYEKKCKNCGSTLQFTKQDTHTKCEYCQIEYEIRRVGKDFILNKFARCPVCGENDLSRKLTSIEFDETFITQEGNQFTTKLAAKIKKPLPPQLLENNGISFQSYLKKIFALLILAVIIEIVGINIFNNGYNQVLFMLAHLTVAFIIFGIVLIIHNYFFHKKLHKIKVFNHNSNELIKFKRAEKRFNELYYCKRDGIVYSIEHNDKHFTLDNYFQYLYPPEY